MTKFALPPEALSQHLAIVGRTGSGKTYAAKGIVEQLLTDKRRVCILDPTGAWYGLRSSADGKKAGFSIAVFGGAHADVPIADQSGGALAKIIAEKNLPAIIDLSEMLIGQRHRFVTDFAEALYRDNRAPLHLVIDEADEFIPQNPMPETKRMLHHVDRIVRRGRIRGFRVMMITQRPAVIHKNVLSQANVLIAMRLTSPQDRKALLSWVEGQADAAQAKAVLDSLARLQRGEGWVWAPEQDLLERVTFPRIATFDSSRTPEDNEVVQQPTKLAEVDIGEIRASFAIIEQEARTLAEIREENRKLKIDLEAARRDLERARKVAPAPVKHPVAPVNNSPNNLEPFRRTLLRIAEMATKAAGAEPANLTKPVVSTATLKSPRVSQPAHTAPSAGLSGPQQSILDTLARLRGFGQAAPNKLVVAALARVSSKSSAFANNLGRLRTLGYIDYPSGGYVALTDSGSAIARHELVVPTIDEIQQGFMEAVPGPQAAIVRALIDIYPQAIAKDALADQLSMSSKSSSFANNLGALRSLGFIDYPTPGMCAARALLFPGK